MLSIINFLQNNKTILLIASIFVLLITIIAISVIRKKKQKISTNDLAIISIFSALSMVLYFIKFPLPIFPSFLEVNLSMLPIIIIGFMFGPIEGLMAVLIRTMLKLPFTSTLCVGEFADFLIGTAVVLSSSIIYQKHKNKKGAIVALICGCIAWVIMGVLSNYLINIPFYLALYFDNNVNALVGALSIIPGVNESNYMIKYLLFAALPFNLLLSVVVCTITFLVYKKISTFIKKFH